MDNEREKGRKREWFKLKVHFLRSTPKSMKCECGAINMGLKDTNKRLRKLDFFFSFFFLSCFIRSMVGYLIFLSGPLLTKQSACYLSETHYFCRLSEGEISNTLERRRKQCKSAPLFYTRSHLFHDLIRGGLKVSALKALLVQKFTQLCPKKRIWVEG